MTLIGGEELGGNTPYACTSRKRASTRMEASSARSQARLYANSSNDSDQAECVTQLLWGKHKSAASVCAARSACSTGAALTCAQVRSNSEPWVSNASTHSAA